MLDNRTMKKAVISSLLGVLSFSATSTAYAWGDRRPSPPADHHSDRRGHDNHYRYPYGRIEFGLPQGSISIVVGNGRFYFGAGHFYQRVPTGYVIVPPPRHEIIYRIPSGCRRIIHGRDVYYTYGGIYYKKLPRGFEIVDTPDFVIVEARNTTANPSIEKTNDFITVNVPNSRGGYTEVILKRSGSGYVGPQGEFYPEFPKVEQLRIIYGS